MRRWRTSSRPRTAPREPPRSSRSARRASAAPDAALLLPTLPARLPAQEADRRVDQHLLVALVADRVARRDQAAPALARRPALRDLDDDGQRVAHVDRSLHVELHVHERDARPVDHVRLDDEPLGQRVGERTGDQPARVRRVLLDVGRVHEQRLVEPAQRHEGHEVVLGHGPARRPEREADGLVLPGSPLHEVLDHRVRHVTLPMPRLSARILARCAAGCLRRGRSLAGCSVPIRQMIVRYIL